MLQKGEHMEKIEIIERLINKNDILKKLFSLVVFTNSLLLLSLIVLLVIYKHNYLIGMIIILITCFVLLIASFIIKNKINKIDLLLRKLQR